MPQYNAKTIQVADSKTVYEYAYKIDIHNPLNLAPIVSFHTADVVLDNDDGSETLGERKRVLREHYQGNESFDVLDPATGAVIGTMDYDTLFVAMYSLFFHVAAKEDS